MTNLYAVNTPTYFIFEPAFIQVTDRPLLFHRPCVFVCTFSIIFNIGSALKVSKASSIKWQTELLKQALFSSVEKDEERQDIPLKTEVSCEGENVDAIQFQGIVNRNDNADKPRLSSSPFSQLSIASDAKACWVYDDDLLQRNLELRKSKIGDLLRKQEGLLEKLGSTPLPRK